MINNKFMVDLNSKELTQKISKVNNEKMPVDNNFKKILNEKSEIYTSNENEINNKLNSKGIINNNEVKAVDDSNFEKAIKEVVEVISNEENFQGNKSEYEMIEEVIALLNQILNSPEFEKLLPVKLEDPMYVTNGNIQFDHINKEAFNLANTILETLNSKNINEVIPSDKVNVLKGALELLSENVLSNTSILPEKAYEQNLEIKDLKTIKTDGKLENSSGNKSDEEIEGELKSIVTELKSTLSSETNSKINNYMDKYGLNSEATETSEEDKVLAKILGENETGSLNKQSTLISRFKPSDVIKEPMVVSKETMDEDIIKNVKFMMKNAVSELKVKIYPKELGEMTIRLLSEEGILKADIRATSKETYNLLHSNLSDIKKSLEQQNIKIYEVNIGLYSEDTTYYSGEQARDEMFKNNENKQGRNSSKGSGVLTEDLEADENIYDDSSVNLLV